MLTMQKQLIDDILTYVHSSWNKLRGSFVLDEWIEMMHWSLVNVIAMYLNTHCYIIEVKIVVSFMFMSDIWDIWRL